MSKPEYRLYHLKKKTYMPVGRGSRNSKVYCVEEKIPSILVEGDVIYEGDTFKDPSTGKIYQFQVEHDKSVSMWEWGGSEYWHRVKLDPEIIERLLCEGNLHSGEYPIWGIGNVE